MVEQGLQVTLNPNGCFVEDMKNQGKLIAKGERNGQMFTLDVNMHEVNSMLFTYGKGAGDIGIWHKRVGHVNLQRFKLMEKRNLVGGLPKFGTEEVMSEVCEACQLGKQARHPFLAQITHVSSKPLEMIHSDVWTTKIESIGGCKYYVSFIDDHTRKVWVYFMKHKGEVFQHFLNFKAMVEKEKEKGVSIKCLRFDGRGEYFSNEFNEYLKEHRIQRKYSCSYSPQQNGVVERKNMHIAKITRAMLNEKNLPNYFWAEAIATIVYIMNRTPTVVVHGMTFEEKFTGKKTNVSHLRVFGCIAYVHVPNEKRSKLDPKAEKCIFIRYSLEQKGYRCFNLSTPKLQVSRDVVFDEMVSWYSPLKVVEDGEARNGDVSSNVEQKSQLINGPQESSISGSSNTPWKGRLRSSNIVHGSSQTSFMTHSQLLEGLKCESK
jgi:transposase InsO family protein